MATRRTRWGGALFGAALIVVGFFTPPLGTSLSAPPIPDSPLGGESGGDIGEPSSNGTNATWDTIDIEATGGPGEWILVYQSFDRLYRNADISSSYAMDVGVSGDDATTAIFFIPPRIVPKEEGGLALVDKLFPLTTGAPLLVTARARQRRLPSRPSIRGGQPGPPGRSEVGPLTLECPSTRKEPGRAPYCCLFTCLERT